MLVVICFLEASILHCVENLVGNCSCHFCFTQALDHVNIHFFIASTIGQSRERTSWWSKIRMSGWMIIETVSPSSTVRVISFNCGMLQMWTWFQWVWYTGLLDSCGYSKKLSSPMVGLCWSQASVILDYYLYIIMFRSYNYSMRLVVASSRGSIEIDLDDLSY
jgi:hypothetical protein